MGFKITQEVLTICQSEKVLISSGRALIFGNMVSSRGIHIETIELRQLSSNLSLSQYKTSKYSSDLQTFIANSSRNLVGLLHHLSQY